MTEIRLTNTATRRKEVLRPIVPGQVSMYVCGPTVYDRAHLGNARPAVVFDVLYRLLRHEYGAGNVRYVRNFTDVDDKINAEALRRKEAGAAGTLEELIAERSEETIGWYLSDMAALGVMEPNDMPRATRWIGQMVAMIEGLVEKGHAYAAEGHVLFRVRSYAEYGALSGRSVDDMIAGARVEVAPYKEDPMDFVLWKPSADDLPGWDSPWGRGRPGWHIECSAMSHGILGERFDIHGGGNDLIFPHHENEIAQSKCMGHGFAQIWMHNEMLQVEGKKMSKSLGNFFTVRDLLDDGIPGEVIRFVMLSTHYRKPMDWTAEKAREADKRLDRLTETLRIAIELGVPPGTSTDDLPTAIAAPLANDLDTHSAIVGLENAAERLRGVSNGSIEPAAVSQAQAIRNAAVEFFTGLEALGLYELLLERDARKADARNLLDDIHLSFVAQYELAKSDKKFDRVDALKALLSDAGVEVRISRNAIDLIPGPDFDPSKLEALK